jgi:hypothetical protein
VRAASVFSLVCLAAELLGVLGRVFFPPAVFPESEKRPPILLGSSFAIAPVGDPFSALERRLGLLVSRGGGVRPSVSVPTANFFAPNFFLPKISFECELLQDETGIVLELSDQKFKFS